MAIVVKFQVTGMDAPKYQELLRRLRSIGQDAPDGRLYHLCYGDTKSLQVIDVFENPTKLDAFGQKLVPLLRDLGIQAVPTPFDAYNIIWGEMTVAPAPSISPPIARA